MIIPLDDEGGYTAVPNWLIDCASTLSPAAFAVAVVICRLTVGWQKESDAISIGRLQTLTGLSKPTIIVALRALRAAGILEHVGIGHRSMGIYRLVKNTDRSSTLTGKEFLPDLVKNIDTQKKHKESSSYEEPTPAISEPVTAPARPLAPPVALAPPLPRLPTGTPTRAVARQVPTDAEQVRLVDAEIADPVEIYRLVAEVTRPNQAQRAAIRAEITSHPDVWHAVCATFRRNGWNVRKLDNLLDAYRKGVIDRLSALARAAEAERAAADAQSADAATPASRARAVEIMRSWRNWRETPAPTIPH